MAASRLADIQRWMQAAITRTSPDSSSVSIDALLPSRQLSAEERLRVYQSAYLARLGECLHGEYPAVAAAVGDDTFNEFVVAYLDRSPSMSYTLGDLGSRFPEFLLELRPPKTDPRPDFGDFLVELAMYERTIAEVFDAEGPETDPLPSEQRLAVTDAATFADGRIEFYPCVRLLRCDFPVHEYRSAVRREALPPVPEPALIHLLISRQEFVVRRWPIPAWQHAMLTELQAGRSVGAALTAAGTRHAPEMSAATIQTAFQEWTTRGVIRHWINPLS